MKNAIIDLLRDRMAQIALLVFAVITIWWFTVHPLVVDEFVNGKNIWSASYELLSFVGGVFGIVIARYWGGYKSVLGRALLGFAVGLFLQTFGQVVYNYYTLFSGINAPYPSLGDIGYFGSIFAYLYGAILLAKASGVHLSLKTYHNKLISVLIPLLMLWGSYSIFLRNYTFDWTAPLKIFLDFGYPLGQACYVSVAILALILSWRTLGGLMRGPVLGILIALIVQYICDSEFLYQANQNSWYPGSPGDYLYAVSYLVMTLALVYVGIRFKQIQES